MSKADDEKMAIRRAAVFKAGAEASTPSHPEFEGRTDLGSMECCTWYDGYASTHPEFQNPYRQRR